MVHICLKPTITPRCVPCNIGDKTQGATLRLSRVYICYMPALSNGVLKIASDPKLLELYDQLPSVSVAATSTWKRITPMWTGSSGGVRGLQLEAPSCQRSPLIVALYLLMLM